MSDRLYFIAVLPPAPVFGEIEEIKQQVALDYGPEHALKAPAHQTLMAPFFFDEERLPLIIAALQEVGVRFRPFSMVLDGYKFFERHAMFLHVLQNRSLRNLEQKVWEKLTASFSAVEWKPRKRFHPHISIAARLDEDVFFKLQKSYTSKPFHASFPVHEMVILRWEPDQSWDVVMCVPLLGKDQKYSV